jgi:hypothetical protein
MPLRYLSGDPLVTRFCGLARPPTRRTVADWLRQFTQETLPPLIALNRDLVTEALARLDLPRLTRWMERSFGPGREFEDWRRRR